MGLGWAHQVFGRRICGAQSVVEQERQREYEWERTRDRLREVQLHLSRSTLIETGKAMGQGSNNKNLWLSCADCPCRLTYIRKSEWAGMQIEDQINIRWRGPTIYCGTVQYDMIQRASSATDVGHTSKACWNSLCHKEMIMSSTRVLWWCTWILPESLSLLAEHLRAGRVESEQSMWVS